MLIGVFQKRTSVWVLNSNISSLLSQKSKETLRYSHTWGCNQTILTLFYRKEYLSQLIDDKNRNQLYHQMILHSELSQSRAATKECQEMSLSHHYEFPLPLKWINKKREKLVFSWKSISWKPTVGNIRPSRSVSRTNPPRPIRQPLLVSIFPTSPS